MKAKTWIAVTDSECMKIFAFVAQENQPTRLVQLEEREHPSSLLKTSELVSDDAGKFRITTKGTNSSQIPGSKYEPKHDPHELEAMHFAKEVADYLAKEHTKGHFDRLILCAADHFCGLLRKEVTPALEKATTWVRKGYTKLPIKEFEAIAHELVNPLKK